MPPGTAHPIAKRVSDELRAVLSEQATKTRFEGYINPTSPAELLASTSSCRDSHGSCLRRRQVHARGPTSRTSLNCSTRLPASNLAAADFGAPPRLAI
jgi:hypothetical protein